MRTIYQSSNLLKVKLIDKKSSISIKTIKHNYNDCRNKRILDHQDPKRKIWFAEEI